MIEDPNGLDCKQVSRLLSDGQDRVMLPHERARLRLHLVICEACRHVDDQLQFVRQAMRRIGKDKDDLLP